VKTAAAREAWARRQSALSGACAICNGSGVLGTRMFKGKIRACDSCSGMGRLAL
jgi:DnaJ-class molecular chaperone